MDSEIGTADPRDQKTYFFHETLTRRLLVALLKGAFLFITDRKVFGVENLPAEGPVIVAANHLTNYDVFPLQFALPRPIFFMGKEELFRNAAMDWLIRRLGGFPVQRGAQDEWAVRHARKVLEHGQVLGMFPEGTRSRGMGLGHAKTGVARLAQAMNCPIVPVALHGPQYMFRHFPRRTRVTVTIGEPIYPQPGETHLGLTDRLMFRLARILPPEGRGVYRYQPPGF
jgi:1-acyl-sn-glycerol-3-phosphate acyltransferase